MQLGGTERYHNYSGPLDCLRQTVRQEGLRGLTRGLGGTMAREMPGNAVCELHLAAVALLPLEGPVPPRLRQPVAPPLQLIASLPPRPRQPRPQRATTIRCTVSSERGARPRACAASKEL